jgi:hypothetical protein
MHPNAQALAAGLMVIASTSTFAATHYVNANSFTPASPYTDWSSAASTIQDAVDVSISGDEIVVTNGIYATGGRIVYTSFSNRVAVTKPLFVHSVDGPQVTVIQGYQVPGTTNGPGAIRCVYLTNGATLSGFTLTNGGTLSGLISSNDYSRQQLGGGVWCESGSMVSNCVIIGNAATDSGAGAYGGTLHN